MMVVSRLCSPQTAEETLCTIRASDTVTIRELVIDPLDDKSAMKIVPAVGIVGVNFAASRNVIANVRDCRSLRLESLWHTATVTLADHDDALTLSVLVFDQAPIASVLFPIGGLHVATEVSAVDFNHLALAAKLATLNLRRHRFAQFMS